MIAYMPMPLLGGVLVYGSDRMSYLAEQSGMDPKRELPSGTKIECWTGGGVSGRCRLIREHDLSGIVPTQADDAARQRCLAITGQEPWPSHREWNYLPGRVPPGFFDPRHPDDPQPQFVLMDRSGQPIEFAPIRIFRTPRTTV